MRANFTDCALLYTAPTKAGEELRSLWGWHGPVVGIPKNNLTQITREGCRQLCGRGPDIYPWEDASSTITTWILPIIGTLLQAPFESNAFKRTVFAITRWIGSPIASLSYVLWNIKVSAKAALMVDMAVPNDQTPERKTDFGSMRDSMYLLLAMNQYTMKETAFLRDTQKEAEGLLRIVLFSKDLKLTDTDKTLRQMRRILARELREMRRRGIVPVFVSTLWFLFAFALSIQAAFGDVGENRTAHDLALGCLLAWFPILIMGSIVDRNPIAADAIRKKLNALVDHVRHSLRDQRHRNDFLDSFKDQPEIDRLRARVEEIAEKSEYMEDFFEDFAGQARIRWHYGAAHPILSDIENCYIAEKGRNWLVNEKEARTSLVLGPVNDEGLVWFDIREFWQVASAIVIVGASCGGAFILSFFTPTVGLGCRSGGYTIFFTTALGLLLVEMVVWLALSRYEFDKPRWVTRTTTRLHNNATFDRWDDVRRDRWAHLKRRTSSMLRSTEGFFIRQVVKLVLLFPWEDKQAVRNRLRSALEKGFKAFRDLSPQKKWERIFFRPVEAFNTIWLVYIVLAQTFGWYKTCDCVTSTWGGAGGYLDFSVQGTSTSPWVAYYWPAGTLLTSIVMAFSMFYVTVEWTQQSFLSTEDYQDAMQGLRRTRKYRHWTFAFRKVSRIVSKYTIDPLEKLALVTGILKKPQKTLLWERKHTHTENSRILQHSATQPIVPAPRTPGNPSIELSDYSTEMVRDDSQQGLDTPALAHSLFPPAIPKRRQRHDSDSSAVRPSPPSPHRLSNEWPHTPPIQHPTGTYHYRERTGSAVSDDERRSSGEDIISPVSPPNDQSLSRPLLGEESSLQPRQGYTRANSDPGSPPTDDGLGIHFDARDLEAGVSRRQWDAR